MKKNLSLACLILIISASFAQTTCNNNITLAPMNSRVTTNFSFQSNDTASWFSFVATATNMRIAIEPLTSTITNPTALVKSLSLYVGSCNSLQLVEYRNIFLDSLSERNAYLLIFADNLSMGQQYFIQVTKQQATNTIEFFALSIENLVAGTCTGGYCDCINPIIVCGAVTTFPLSVGAGNFMNEIPPQCSFGNPGNDISNSISPCAFNTNPDPNGGYFCLKVRDNHSPTWILFTVTKTGALRFNFAAGTHCVINGIDNQFGLYDWAMYRVDGVQNYCSAIMNNQIM